MAEIIELPRPGHRKKLLAVLGFLAQMIEDTDEWQLKYYGEETLDEHIKIMDRVIAKVRQ